MIPFSTISRFRRDRGKAGTDAPAEKNENSTNLKIVSVSFLIAPVLVFLHEAVHFAVLNLTGMKAVFRGFSLVGIVGFDYDVIGISDAIAYYNASPKGIVLEAISAPLFTLIVACISLFLFKRRHMDIFWHFSFTPLCLRMLGVTALLPRILRGDLLSTDEVIFAYYLRIPPVIAAAVSLTIGYTCIGILCMCLGKGKRLRYCVASLIGGSMGYLLAEFLVNKAIGN